MLHGNVKPVVNGKDIQMWRDVCQVNYNPCRTRLTNWFRQITWNYIRGFWMKFLNLSHSVIHLFHCFHLFTFNFSLDYDSSKGDIEPSISLWFSNISKVNSVLSKFAPALYKRWTEQIAHSVDVAKFICTSDRLWIVPICIVLRLGYADSSPS